METDLTPCTGCKEMIISARHVLFIELKMGERSELIPAKVQLCQSCYQGIKPQNETEPDGPQ